MKPIMTNSIMILFNLSLICQLLFSKKGLSQGSEILQGKKKKCNLFLVLYCKYYKSVKQIFSRQKVKSHHQPQTQHLETRFIWVFSSHIIWSLLSHDFHVCTLKYPFLLDFVNFGESLSPLIPCPCPPALSPWNCPHFLLVIHVIPPGIFFVYLSTYSICCQLVIGSMSTTNSTMALFLYTTTSPGLFLHISCLLLFNMNSYSFCLKLFLGSVMIMSSTHSTFTHTVFSPIHQCIFFLVGSKMCCIL